MIRIAGINLQPKKQIRFALTPIKGIGKSNVKVLLNKLKIDPSTKLGDIDEETIVLLRNTLEADYLIDADLRRKTASDIKHLVEVKSWRGGRHMAGLPVRGQTTKVNSRTRRGNKRSAGSSGKIKAK